MNTVSSGASKMNDTATSAIAMEEVLRVVRLDAEKAHRDLSGFRIVLALREDGWHVDFEILSKTSHGGGPHYLIDSSNGAILWKTYQQ
jgi:hypothetical protein